jgi:hypothetical protein
MRCRLQALQQQRQLYPISSKTQSRSPSNNPCHNCKGAQTTFPRPVYTYSHHIQIPVANTNTNFPIFPCSSFNGVKCTLTTVPSPQLPPVLLRPSKFPTLVPTLVFVAVLLCRLLVSSSSKASTGEGAVGVEGGETVKRTLVG